MGLLALTRFVINSAADRISFNFAGQAVLRIYNVAGDHVADRPEPIWDGRNDFGALGYGGPCPPPGPAHRYFFKLYALDFEPALGAGASKAELMSEIAGHILAEGRLMGRYGR